ncbi:MAG: GerAB/ArcD/ProY family transporter, partial [Sulfobacillus sp.]
MVTVSVVAGGVYLWPQYVVKTEGTNGVWALLTTTGVALGIMTLQVLWVKMTKKTPYALMVRDTLGVVG